MKKVLVLAVFGVFCAQANIVANGGFELSTGLFTGPGALALHPGDATLNNWAVYYTGTLTGNQYPVALLAGPYLLLAPSEGSRWIDLSGNVDSPTLFGGVSQTLNTVVGQTYQVSFDVGICNGGCGSGVYLGGPVSILARIDGASSYTATNNSAAAGNQWLSFQFLFTATSTNTLLAFEGSGNSAKSYNINLDNVAVEVVAPEPASFALFGIGAAGLLAFARKRRR